MYELIEASGPGTEFYTKRLPEKNFGGFMRCCYVEAPELGHYLEYILPEAAGIEFFESVPNN